MQRYTIKDLEDWNERIQEQVTEFGLSCYPQEFEICDQHQMLGYLAYNGMPAHYPHWSFGKAFEKQKTVYDYGMSGLPYEMVINSNPSLAYLMKDNSLALQILTIAHVYAHSHYFKNNRTFRFSRPEYTLEMFKAHAGRIRAYIEDPSIGLERVEKLLDAAHALSLNSRRYLEVQKRTPKEIKAQLMESYQKDCREARERLTPEPALPDLSKVPLEPEEDILLFLRDYNPYLVDWQRDILTIVAEETQYFLPQMETKIMNEGWACATGDTLLFTDRGMMRFDELYARGSKMRVAGGGGNNGLVSAFHRERRAPTLRIKTQRGYEIEGALNHQVLREDGSWAYLKDLRCGDVVTIGTGGHLWPKDYVQTGYTPARPSSCIAGIATAAGVSPATVIRHRQGKKTRRAVAIEQALLQENYQPLRHGRVQPNRKELQVSGVLDERMAYLAGYYVGNGCRQDEKSILFTCGELKYARNIAAGIKAITGVSATVRWDTSDGSERARVLVHSKELQRLFISLGVDLKAKAAEKSIPWAVLCSPKSVVSAFLRGYFDADAYAGDRGIILVTASSELARQVQVLLLNYGILSSKRLAKDRTYRITIQGKSAWQFARDIGFRLPRKSAALKRYLDSHQWYKEQKFSSNIVEIESGEVDVFDITVDETHTYVGNGFVNHNSFWHYQILNALDLPQGLHVEYLIHHNQVVRPVIGGLNPYHLGFKIFEDIEKRFGRDRIFQAVETDRDVSFLRQYLTEELMRELHLFSHKKDGSNRIVDDISDEEGWEEVKKILLKSVGLASFPTIKILDANYKGQQILYLWHEHEGRDLELSYAQETVRHLFALWQRRVILESRLEGKPVFLSYDGKETVKVAYQLLF